MELINKSKFSRFDQILSLHFFKAYPINIKFVEIRLNYYFFTKMYMCEKNEEILTDSSDQTALCPASFFRLHICNITTKTAQLLCSLNLLPLLLPPSLSTSI